MPIYEFKCAECGHQFEDLVPAGTDTMPCPKCQSDKVFRLISLVSSKGMAAACSGCAPSPSGCKGCAHAR